MSKNNDLTKSLRDTGSNFDIQVNTNFNTQLADGEGLFNSVATVKLFEEVDNKLAAELKTLAKVKKSSQATGTGKTAETAEDNALGRALRNLGL